MSRRLLFVLCFLPALALAAHIAADAVNIHAGTEWLMARTALDAGQGWPAAEALMAPLDGSRPVLPRLAVDVSARFLRGSDHLLLALPLVLGLAAAFALWLVLRRTVRGRWPQLAGLAAMTFLIFSPVGYTTWLWGLGFAYLAPPALLAACLAVNRSRWGLWPKVGFAAVAALAASACHVSGLAVWPLAFPWAEVVAPLSGRRSRLVLPAVVYGALMCLTFAVYFSGWHLPPVPADAQDLEAAGLPEFLATWLGGTLVGDGGGARPLPEMYPKVASFLGGLCLLLYAGAAVLAWRRREHPVLLRAMLPWLSLGAFGILAGVTMWAVGVRPELDAALDPLQFALSWTMPAALAGLFVQELGLARRSRARVIVWVTLGLGVFAAPSLYHTYVEGYAGMARMRAERRQEQLAVRFMAIMPDNPMFAHMAPEGLDLQALVAALDKAGELPLTPVAPEFLPPDPQSPLHGHFDTAESFGQGSLRVAGWAATTDGSEPVVLLASVDPEGRPRPFAALAADLPRPDVVKTLSLPTSARPGFKGAVRGPESGPNDILVQAWGWTPSENVVRQLQGEHVVSLRDLPLDPVHVTVPQTPAQEFRGSLDQVRFDGEHLIVAGWAADVQRMQPVDQVLIRVTNASGLELTTRLAVGLPRPDVAAVLNSRNLTDSGFEAILSLANLPPKTQQKTLQVQAWVLSHDGHLLAQLQPAKHKGQPPAKKS